MTSLNVLRVRKRRQRRNVERHLGVQELLVFFGGVLLLLLLWGLVGPGWAVLLAMLGAAVAGIVPWVRGSMYTTHPTRHDFPLLGHNRHLRGVDTTQATRHRHEVPNYEKRVFRVGLLVLLLAAFVVLVFSVPGETFQEWAALASTPKPRDCDWTSRPLGDKHCHYEHGFQHVIDRQGEHLAVEWQRVDDY